MERELAQRAVWPVCAVRPAAGRRGAGQHREDLRGVGHHHELLATRAPHRELRLHGGGRCTGQTALQPDTVVPHGGRHWQNWRHTGPHQLLQ